MIMTGIRYHLHSTMNYVTFFLNVHLPLQNQNCAYEEKGLSLRNVQCVKCLMSVLLHISPTSCLPLIIIYICVLATGIYIEPDMRIE